ncbi:hypothetical protein F511_02066 [Dorcoceras hygrometricum]|uniref:Uncharacterized protein n=1 Tax=Dorcoceras hygrometricum TaxID=472368 RepID=A0A2Z7BY92_9LAMI|nr:hypothetical protein F511_02066 [Dorcoceras hygrometricum]
MSSPDDSVTRRTTESLDSPSSSWPSSKEALRYDESSLTTRLQGQRPILLLTHSRRKLESFGKKCHALEKKGAQDLRLLRFERPLSQQKYWSLSSLRISSSLTWESMIEQEILKTTFPGLRTQRFCISMPITPSFPDHPGQPEKLSVTHRLVKGK